jgi:hypothetical protein
VTKDEIQDLIKNNLPLPAELTSVGGDLNLRGYDHPLPAGLASVGGSLDLRSYTHPLPEDLTNVGGLLQLDGYNHPLSPNLTNVGGGLFLDEYDHVLPAGLKSVGGYLSLGGYKHPLPAGLTRVGSYLLIGGYNHPLPSGLSVVSNLLIHAELIPSTKDQTNVQVFNRLLETVKLHNLDRENHIPVVHTGQTTQMAYACALYPSLFAPLSDELCVPVSSLAWPVSDALKPGRVYTSEQRADCLIEEVSIASLHALAEIYPSREELTAYLSDVIKKRLGKMQRAAKKAEGARNHHNSR